MMKNLKNYTSPEVLFINVIEQRAILSTSTESFITDDVLDPWARVS